MHRSYIDTEIIQFVKHLATSTDEVSGFDSQHFRASASDGICSAVRVVEVRLEGEPAQMGFEAAVPSVAMTMAECAHKSERPPLTFPIACVFSCLAYLVGWHRYLGMLELTRALRYTWHSHTNLIPGLTFMLAVSFRRKKSKENKIVDA
ncbi:WAT1-related protein [Salix suchowensis]|nr:WAT1-related protein [Salix suchowensis]